MPARHGYPLFFNLLEFFVAAVRVADLFVDLGPDQLVGNRHMIAAPPSVYRVAQGKG
jgi:hypothetical protein